MVTHLLSPSSEPHRAEVPSATRADRVRARSAARREAERLQLRDRVLQIAQRQLVAHGYQRFSLREVAEEAGYSPTALYRHFADRDALLKEVCARYFAQFSAVLVAADRSATDPRERLMAQAQAYVQFAIDNPAVYRLMFMERPEMGMGLTMEEVANDAGFGVLAQAVGALAATGGIGSLAVSQATMVLWAGVHGLAAMVVTMNLLPAAHFLTITRAMSTTMLDGLQQG